MTVVASRAARLSSATDWLGRPKAGGAHVVEEARPAAAHDEERPLPLPQGWEKTITGEPMPDWAALVRRSREGQ